MNELNPSARLITYVRTLLMTTGVYTLDQINERAPGLAAELQEIVSEDIRVDYAIPERDRGAMLNELATMGMRLTTLRAELPEVEKQARKTPRKDMHAERTKVEHAKMRVEPLRTEIVRLAADYAALHGELIRLGAYPGSVPSFAGDNRPDSAKSGES